MSVRAFFFCPVSFIFRFERRRVNGIICGHAVMTGRVFSASGGLPANMKGMK
jgi:hypothetical protein